MIYVEIVNTSEKIWVACAETFSTADFTTDLVIPAPIVSTPTTSPLLVTVTSRVPSTEDFSCSLQSKTMFDPETPTRTIRGDAFVLILVSLSEVL